MKKIILLGNISKKKIRETITELEPLFRKKSHLSVVDISNEDELKNVSADFVLVFGGDGTILSASRKLNDKQIPLIGVHMGNLDFWQNSHYKISMILWKEFVQVNMLYRKG